MLSFALLGKLSTHTQYVECSQVSFRFYDNQAATVITPSVAATVPALVAQVVHHTFSDYAELVLLETVGPLSFAVLSSLWRSRIWSRWPAIGLFTFNLRDVGVLGSKCENVVMNGLGSRLTMHVTVLTACFDNGPVPVLPMQKSQCLHCV